MTTDTSSRRRESFELAGDGGLMTAALFAVLISIALAATMPFGDREVPMWVQALSAIGMWVGLLGGPTLAWLLHGRRITLFTIVGAVLGAPVTGALFAVFVLFATILSWAISPISTAEWAGPLAAGVLIAVAFAAALVWLIFDALRDLRASTRVHLTIDRVRIAAAILVVVYTGAITAAAITVGGEIVEAIAFMLLGSLAGAVIVTTADIATRWMERTQDKPEATVA